MIYGSTFSGIGGIDLALNRAGMQAAWMAEIDRAASRILEAHNPGVPNYGDIKNVSSATVQPVDLLVGGFPCQDVSIAGRRKGLAGKRSGLWFEFARVVAELKPRWILIENVPGLLSTNGGADFAVILQGMVDLGYGVAWRVLDSQYAGVPQRRRRVFIVGYSGDGRAAKVLFESEGLSWDPPTGRDPAHRVTGTLDAKSSSSVRGSQANERDFLIYNIHQNDDGRKDRPLGGLYVQETDQALTMQTNLGKSKTVIASLPILWQNRQQTGEVRVQNETMPAVTTTWGTGGNNVPFVGVRRLTPVECERLQGFPDGWTAGQKDAARYRQLGNAVTVPVVEWIARRILRYN